jgi:ABC-type transport system involved in Fe-S cluster assembly fused permease/ATPase subunit
MSLLEEFVVWFTKFVAVSVTLLIAVYIYGRKQRLKAKQEAEQADQQKQAPPSGMRRPRRS